MYENNYNENSKQIFKNVPTFYLLSFTYTYTHWVIFQRNKRQTTK